MEGGTIYLKFPENLQIPNNVVQQIQISHNFTESYIISEEVDWYSISFYNSEKELIIVIVLEKHEDGKDYLVVLEEFNKQIDLDIKEKKFSLFFACFLVLVFLIGSVSVCAAEKSR